MRDPNRIPEILKVLERVWTQHPDLRLGQLIDVANVYYWRHVEKDKRRYRSLIPHIFDIEDVQLIQGLEALEKDTNK